MSTTAPPPYIGHSFIDHASGKACVLRIDTDPLTAGVIHDECPVVADVMPHLDAYYCSVCNYNGRISGAWYVRIVEGAARASLGATDGEATDG